MASRRLAELLEEQQEPFLLDDYLIQNGYSRKILSSQPSTMCWPGGNACRRLQRLSGGGFKRRRGGFLRFVITKLLYGNSIRKAFHWESRTSTPEFGRLSVFFCFSDMGSNKTHDAEPAFSSDSGAGFRELGRWSCMEVEQLSPVSVLDLHSDNGSPFHSHSKGEKSSEYSSLDSPWPIEASRIFDELLESAICAEEKINWADPNVGLTPMLPEKFIQDEILSWERHKGDASSINQLVGSDLSNSRKDWRQLREQRNEIGIEIEAAVFEEIREEAILDMLGFHCT